jgi:hypothetical protein
VYTEVLIQIQNHGLLRQKPVLGNDVSN